MVVKRITVGEQATEVLRSRIINRELLPGQPLTEEAMANTLGVSRPTIRQALATLESEGLVTRSDTNRVLQVTRLEAQDVVEIYRARRVLELAGVEAVRTAPQERLDGFWTVLERLEEASRSEVANGQVVADFEIHESIVGLLDSKHLLELERLLLTRLRLASTVLAEQSEWQTMARANRELCAYLTTREVDKARAVLADRLEKAEHMVLRSLEADADI